MHELGDEIFADCDSIALELDLEKETVKQTLRYAKKYGKKVFAVVSNMSIAMERREFLQLIDCFICNQQEAGLLCSDDYDHLSPDEMCRVLTGNVRSANIPSMVVTMGGQGAVYACADGSCGIVPAKKVDVMDTTGAGDAFAAALAWSFLEGVDLIESARAANAAAAIAEVGEKTITVALKEGMSAEAKGTYAYPYPMGLTEADFTVTSDNYSNIKVVVNDGSLEITPVTDKVTVTIKGNNGTIK